MPAVLVCWTVFVAAIAFIGGMQHGRTVERAMTEKLLQEVKARKEAQDKWDPILDIPGPNPLDLDELDGFGVVPGEGEVDMLGEDRKKHFLPGPPDPPQKRKRKWGH